LIFAIRKPQARDRKKHGVPARKPDTAAFENQIREQRDILYGIALFFEGLAVLYLEQGQIIETYRRQFRNLIRHNQEELERATALLERARHGEAGREELADFRFNIGDVYPNAKQLVRRARILVRTYEDIFPGRDRADPFSKEETLRLLEAAAERL